MAFAIAFNFFREGPDNVLALFFALWLIFNGRITLEIILFGIAVSAACFWVTCRLFGWSLRRDLGMWKKVPGILRLLGTLLVEIARANFAVIRRVYSRRAPEPVFHTFEASLKSSLSRFALANCITLTPGTITGEVEGGRYTVHCLDVSMADGLEENTFITRLQALEEETK